MVCFFLLYLSCSLQPVASPLKLQGGVRVAECHWRSQSLSRQSISHPAAGKGLQHGAQGWPGVTPRPSWQVKQLCLSLLQSYHPFDSKPGFTLMQHSFFLLEVCSPASAAHCIFHKLC